MVPAFASALGAEGALWQSTEPVVERLADDFQALHGWHGGPDSLQAARASGRAAVAIEPSAMADRADAGPSLAGSRRPVPQAKRRFTAPAKPLRPGLAVRQAQMDSPHTSERIRALEAAIKGETLSSGTKSPSHLQSSQLGERLTALGVDYLRATGMGSCRRSIRSGGGACLRTPMP